jgi:hypothetical protein
VIPSFNASGRPPGHFFFSPKTGKIVGVKRQVIPILSGRRSERARKVDSPVELD